MLKSVMAAMPLAPASRQEAVLASVMPPRARTGMLPAASQAADKASRPAGGVTIRLRRSPVKADLLKMNLPKTGPKRIRSAACWAARRTSSRVWQETLTVGGLRERLA